MLRRMMLGAAILALPGPHGWAQTVDELIARNVAARGGIEKMRAVRSIRMTGKMTIGPGMEVPIRLELKRPNRVRMEFTFQGTTGVQAYDGKAGWAVNPFAPTQEPVPLTEDEAKDIEEQADLDGPLVDYDAKGHTVELVGQEKVEGRDAHKLKITLKGGGIRYQYLAADTFLTIREEATRQVRGTPQEIESTVGDYKDVGGGLLMPHSIQNGAKGQPEKQNILLETVELNPALDDAHFKMPEAAKADPATTQD